MRQLRFFAIVMAFLSFLPFCPAQTYEIAPGVSLPTSGMVAALDVSGSAPKVVMLHATEIKSNSHAGGNFARSMVYAGPRSGVELEGVHGPVTLQSGKASFFVRLSTDDPETQRNRVTLLRLKPLKETREVLTFSANVFGGSRKRHVDAIAIQKVDVVDGAWVKITPDKPLEPGEYGIMFLPKDEMLFADSVYDFSVGAAR